MPATYDLLLRGGHLIDPAQKLNGRYDVAFAGGRVAAVAEHLPPEDAAEVVDVHDQLVTPGLIDLHGHFYEGVGRAAVNADLACLRNGVTTGIDAGSAGWMTYNGLRKHIIDRVDTRVLAFLHISATGLVSLGVTGELTNLDFAQVDQCVACIDQNRDKLIGVKVRIAHGATGAANAEGALRRAREAADRVKLPLMVHVSDTPIPLPAILDVLRPGDIATHIFNGYAERVLDDRGEIRAAVRDAAERGVVMDVGHAGVHFDVEVARRAIEIGFYPDTLSTDIHTPPPDRTVYHIPGLISKFLALGLPIEDGVAATTANAAKAIGKAGELGTLAPGAIGDAAVFAIEEGRYRFVDTAGHEVLGDRRLRPALTVLGGRVWRSGGDADVSPFSGGAPA